jgi:hypothetical protein
MSLLNSPKHNLLRFDDAREMSSGKTGKYILENFKEMGTPVILD